MRNKWFQIAIPEKDFPVEVRERLLFLNFIHKWAYVRHIDADLEPHYHVYVEFRRISCEKVFFAKILGINERYVSSCGDKKTFLTYLCSKNDFSRVVSNFNIPDYIEFLTYCG